ncbi:MAG: inorganic phosphate transporter [Candidatus Glassbacteria bacterium]
MAELTSLVVFIIALALLFDFLNGFHDAANAIATVVVTKTLTPFQAVLLAGSANFIGYFFFGVAIATTVGKGVIDTAYVTLPLILAALVGAILWNILTWLLGLPTSSSHALIGGLIGSAVVAVGLKAVIFTGVIKIFLFIFIAPIIGMVGAIIFTTIILWLFHRYDRTKLKNLFKRLQLVSATVYSVGHGTNDAQKTMGIITLVLFSAGIIPTFHVDNWVIFTCHASIALGTVFGGWRIVKTMGTRITKIRAMEGFCAETLSALVLLGTAHLGIPVSTTHVIAGSIMGVGTVEHARNVRWVTARRIIWAWILTIPATALIAGASYFVISIFL